MNIGPEVRDLLDRLVPNKSKYFDTLRDLLDDEFEDIGKAITSDTLSAFRRLIESMPVSLCSLEYDIAVDMDDGTINLCLDSSDVQFTIYNDKNDRMSVVWRRDCLSGYVIFASLWPATLEQAVCLRDPLYLYATIQNSETIPITAMSCMYIKDGSSE